MKVYNLSYNNKELFEEVYAVTGKPYGFIKSIGQGGTGSPPLTIYDAPEEVMKIMRQNVDKKYTNIEVLRQGVIIRFKSRLENYGVPVSMADIQAIEITPIKNDDTFSQVLNIGLTSGESFRFSIKNHELPGVIKFFSKKFFEGKTHF